MEVLETAVLSVPVFKVTGDVDHGSASVLEERLHESLLANGTRLLMDLSECPYLDSAGLSVLVYALREVRGKGWIGVIAPSRNLLRLFELTGLSADPDFRVFAGFGEATTAIEGDKSGGRDA